MSSTPFTNPVSPEQLEQRLISKTARVAVLGLGYVGLPLAVEFAKAGFTVIGLAGEGETDISEVPDLDGPVLIVVGSEDDGLARLVRTNCDYLARIPINSEVESLNASVAAAIALYEVTRFRG